MSNLFISTLTMMGLTFAIGFFVAAIIKVIANWADFLDFYQTHRKELLNLKKIHSQPNIPALETLMPLGRKHSEEGFRKLVHKINEVIHNPKFKKRVTA